MLTTGSVVRLTARRPLTLMTYESDEQAASAVRGWRLSDSGAVPDGTRKLRKGERLICRVLLHRAVEPRALARDVLEGRAASGKDTHALALAADDFGPAALMEFSAKDVELTNTVGVVYEIPL